MLDRIKTELPQVQVIILTAHDSLHNAIESIKRGAYHFISKRTPAPRSCLVWWRRHWKHNSCCEKR